MQRWTCRASVLAVTMLFAWCLPAAAQDYAGREKLRAESTEFRREVIRVTDGVYVAVGYSASNVILIQGTPAPSSWILPRIPWLRAPSGPRWAASCASQCERSSTPTPTRITPAGRASLPERIIPRS